MRAAALLLCCSVCLAGDREAACLKHARGVGDHLLGRLDAIEGHDVYSGGPGVALFLVGLHAKTKDARYLAGAKALLEKAAAAPLKGGLYTGRAGVGQACLDGYLVSKDKALLATAEACARRLGEPEATDVIYGAAGMGIFLLNLHAATGRWLDEADTLGRYLVRHAKRENGRASWVVAPGSDRVYIGFSHGAAGIGYFLLHLHRATKKAVYRDLAVEAARFVIETAHPDGDDGWKWTKMHPARKQAFPVQWCHGSPGNALFFLDLHRHVGGDLYKRALDRCVAANLREGKTARVGGCQCHGSGGNADVLIEVYRTTGDKRLLDAAHAWAKDLADESGVKLTVGRYTYPPGYMLGLAGIGQFFLRLSDPTGVPMPLMVARD